MPGWYKTIRHLLGNGQIEAVGIIQEQHPDRTALFNQWQRLPMLLLADPLNRLDVEAVPIVMLVDEHDVIRFRNPKRADFQNFLANQYEDTGQAAPSGRHPVFVSADRLALQGKSEEAIARYESLNLKSPAERAALQFRLGVVRRMRYDTGRKAGGDQREFQLAVSHWHRALQLDPNQYIWRRRIQQYGPVLDKPYPFYRWIERARRDLIDRGESPVALAVEPAGAELADPEDRQERTASGAKSAQSAANEHPSPFTAPDPTNRMTRDFEGLMPDGVTRTPAISIETVAVAATDPAQRATRLHVFLAPDSRHPYSWNNEAEGVTIWLESDQPSVRIPESRLEYPNPQEATSSEPRILESEVTWDETTTTPVRVQGYAVYNICNKENGTCLIRRQDFQIAIGE